MAQAATLTSVNEPRKKPAPDFDPGWKPALGKDRAQIVKKLAFDPIQPYRSKASAPFARNAGLHFNQSVSCTFLIRPWLMNGSTVLEKASRTC